MPGRHGTDKVRCSTASRGNRCSEAQRPKDTWCELAAQCGQYAARKLGVRGTQPQTQAGASQEETTVPYRWTGKCGNVESTLQGCSVVHGWLEG